MLKSEVISFVKNSRSEPYLFSAGLFISLKVVCLQLLIQDKLCLSEFKETREFCSSLSTSPESKMKNEIIGKASYYMTIVIMIQTLPGVIWSLFIGIGCDKFIKGRQIFMILSVTSGIIDSIFLYWTTTDFYSDAYYVILAFIPGSLIGNIFGTLVSVYSYASVHTPTHLRSLRYTLLELVWSIGMSLGSYFGGQLLTTPPILGSREQLKNYSGIFAVCIILNVISFLWIAMFINETDDSEDKDLSFKSKTVKLIGDVLSLFDPRPIKELIKVSIKKRQNGVRLELWLVILALCFVILPSMGTIFITFPVVQRIYLWDPITYSSAASIGNIINPIVMIGIIPILIKVVKVSDISLAIIGTVSGMLSGIMKGSILSPTGLYLSYLIGPLTGGATVAIRSHVSKIVPKEEISRIFSLIATIEAFVPFLGTFYQTAIFNWTINEYPSFVFHFTTFLLFIPLIIFILIDLKHMNSTEEVQRHGSTSQITRL